MLTVNAKKDANSATYSFNRPANKPPAPGGKSSDELNEERRSITEKILVIQEKLLALLENFTEHDAELKEELKSQR